MVKEKKGKSRSGEADLHSVQGSSDEKASNAEGSAHPPRHRDKSRLRRHRGGDAGRGDDHASDDSDNISKKSQQPRGRRKKRKKKRSSRANTTTGTTATSSEWTAGDRRSRSRLPSQERKKESKPKELSEKDLVVWMQKMVPYVSFDSPYWNKWTLAPLYHFIRNPKATLCIAFILNSNSKNGGRTATEGHTSPEQSVLGRLSKICQGDLITFNQLIPEYRGEFFYFLKIHPVSLDGLNYDEVVLYGNVSSGNQVQCWSNLLVHYWTPILMDEECLPIGIRNDVFTELNTVSCATQTTTHFVSTENPNELLLYIPPEIYRESNEGAIIDGVDKNGEIKKKSNFEMARDKDFGSRLEETVVYWITKLKQVIVLQQELDDTDGWPGPLEEIQFWTSRAKNLKNILAQIHTQPMRRILHILAISHSHYLLELKTIFEQVSACYQEATSNAHYLQPLRQPLEKLPKCPLKEVRVEIQKVIWLTLVIWRNAPFYNTPARLNSLLRKFSNALIVNCNRRINVKELLAGEGDIPRHERKLKNCLKCLEWWREIYQMTESMHAYSIKNIKTSGWKPWVFEAEEIFVHVDAMILRIQDLLEICKVQKLYKVDRLPLYPGIKGPFISRVMKNCELLLCSKLEELVGVSDLVLNMKNTEWHEHMNGFRETVLAIDMSVQNVLEQCFEQMPNLKRKVELMQLFHRFYEKRDVVTRQLDKLCVKLYEHFEQEMMRLRKLFERKIVPLPRTYTETAGKGTWVDLMKRRIENDLETLKRAEGWLPKTSGIGFQNLVKSEAKSLADAMGSYSSKCYSDWAREFQQLEPQTGRENHRSKLEVPLLIRRGKAQLVKVNFDRSVYRHLSEAEMWARSGRSVPPVLLLTIYPFREKLHGLRENVWMIAKWYNLCMGGLSRDEKLLFKDRLLPVEKKIYPCLSQGGYTWISGRTADLQYLDEFRALAREVIENVREYRVATSKISEIIEKICKRRLVKMKKVGGGKGHTGGIYDGVEEFREEQNSRIEDQLKKIVKAYREIARILKELFVILFKGDGVEVKVQWGKYVNLVDSCVEEALKFSVRKSLAILEDAVGSDDGEKPVFRVKIILADRELRFEPGLEEMSATVVGVHRNLAKAVEPLMRLGRFLGTGKMGISWKKGEDGGTGYMDAILRDEMCLEVQKRLEFAVERCYSEVNLYAERWIPYRDIWEVDRESFLKNYEKQYPDITAYEKDLKRYMDISEIVHGGDSVVTIRWLQLDCTTLKEGVSEESTKWFQCLAETLYDKAKEDLTAVYNYMEGNKMALSREPGSLQEQLDMWKVAQSVKGEVRQKMFGTFPGIHERFELLRRHNFQFESGMEEMELNLEGAWRKYLRFLREADEKLDRSRDRLKLAFLDQGNILKGKIDELLRIWETEGPFSKQNEDESSAGALLQLENFRNEVKALMEEERELLEALDTFDLVPGKNRGLMELERDIESLTQVWKQVEMWEDSWQKWKNEKIKDLEVNGVDSLTKEFLEHFQELNKQFEIKSWPIINEMLDYIEIIKTSVKCCLFLRKNTLQARHWEWIKTMIYKTAAFKVDHELLQSPENLDLSTVIQVKLYDLLGPISEVSWSSEKEMVVEQTLEKIQDFWENEAFILKRQKPKSFEAGTPFEIQCSPQLEDTLMDHIVSLAAMKGSTFIGVFQEKLEYWDKSLQNTNEILRVILETQQEWLKLERVFCKEHIQREMPGAARSFSVVTSVWASVLLIVTQVRYVVKVVNETEDLLEMLTDLQEKMKDVRSELAVYLQEIRQEFPRLYFLPDDQLLECLGEEDGEMKCLMDAVGKIFGNFGGVSKLSIMEENDGRFAIGGIVSKLNGEEVLKLLRPVNVCSGLLDIFLGDLEREIHASVQRNLKDCLTHLRGGWNKMEEWSLKTDQWTEQSLVTALKIQWTANVSKAIKENGDQGALINGELKKMIKKLKRNVQKFVGILKELGNSKNGQATKVEGVLVTLIYLRDVTERLYARNCMDTESFEWLQYMRWYWSNDYTGGCVTMRQGFAAIPYGWEYCAGGGSCVMTCLTERSFLSLTTAIGYQMGAVIHGSENTGKRETINNLGFQLGKLVLNLRVNEQTEYSSVSCFITGVVQTGAWAVFRDVDSCSHEILNLLKSKLALIHQAKIGNHERIMLDGMQVKLNSGCGIFAVITTCGEGINRCQQDTLTKLKSVMRPLALVMPDCKNILEVKFFMAGFESCMILAKKIETIFASTRKSNSQSAPFSLTSMLVVANRAIQLKQRLQGKKLNESEAVMMALEKVILPSLTSKEEISMFFDLLKTNFPTEQTSHASIKGEHFHLEYYIRQSFVQLGYQSCENMVRNCLQLHELIQMYSAVAVVGKTGSGKSVVRKVLKNAMNLLHRHQESEQLTDGDQEDCNYYFDEDFKVPDNSNADTIKEYIINPATVEGTAQLFGESITFDRYRRWRDGIVTKILRNQKAGILWLVLDGPLRSCRILEETKNSSFITLANCDEIAVRTKITTFLEADSIRDTSPGLLAKCGVLFIQDAQEDEAVWKLTLQAWLNSLTNSSIKAELNGYAQKVLEKCLEFRVENCTSLATSMGALQLVEMFISLETTFLRENALEKLEHKDNKENLSLIIKQITAFSIVWTVFAGLNEESQQKASVFLKDLSPFQQIYPAKRTVFDYFIDLDNRKWVNWDSNPSIGLPMTENDDVKYDQIIHTTNTVKADFLIKRYTSQHNSTSKSFHNMPVLICGPVNSGKSKLVLSSLESNKLHCIEGNSSGRLSTLHIQKTPMMTAHSMQKLIVTRLEPVSSLCLSPSSGKSLTVFIDDLNVGSMREEISSFDEFLGYLIEYWMWYDLETKTPIAISNVNIIAAMTTSVATRNAHPGIQSRLQRKFAQVYLSSPDEFQLRRIFTQKAKQKLEHFAPAVKLLADDITLATLETYKLISTKIRQHTSVLNHSENSVHPFHIFSLYDVSRVYSGLFRAHKDSQDTKLGFIRLWFHECIRTFHDLLSDPLSRSDCLDILEKQLVKHFEISSASLFPPRSNGMGYQSGIDNTNPIIFGNFMKSSKCYEEVKNMEGVWKLLVQKLQSVLSGIEPVVLFKEAILQIVKIARILSQGKGHLIVCGENGQGRESLTRVAASLYQFRIFQMPINDRNNYVNQHTFIDVLKEAYFTCAVENVGCCVILKDEQITEDTLKWSSIATGTVEIPGLFSKKEVAEIIKENTTNKSEDIPSVDIMAWFKERVESNFHLILLITPSNKKILNDISHHYPRLLKQMNLNWFDIWTEGSFLEVARGLMNPKDSNVDVYPGKSSYSSPNVLYAIHSVATEESNVVSPMQFLDFVEFYTWYRKQAAEEYMKRMKTFKNAIEEIGNVRSRIGALTEQAESAERKAESALKQCQEMMVVIERQESDTNAQDSIVTEKDGQLSEEIKEYEELAMVIKQEWSEALGDFENETQVLQDMTEDDLTHIRSYFSPPPLVSKVLDAVMIMLDREPTWPEAKIQLAHPGFIKSILEYDKARISLEKLNNLRKFLQNKEFTPEAVAKHSNGARVLCAWIHAIEKYGRCYLTKICPKREKLEHSEHSILEHKHTLLLASEKLQLLRENLAEIQTIYETKWQFKESLEEDAKQCSDILGRAVSVLKLLEQEEDGSQSNHVKNWKANLVHLERKMEFLEVNALLCSAYLAYGGLFNRETRRRLKIRWIQEIEDSLKFKISAEWNLEDSLDFENTIEPSEKLQIWLKGFYLQRNADPEAEWLAENILIVKKSKRPVICLNPHGYDIENNGGMRSEETRIVIEGKSVKSKLMEHYYSHVNGKSSGEESKNNLVYTTKDLNQEQLDKQITSRFAVLNFALSEQGLKNYFTQKIAKLISLEEEQRRKALIQAALAERLRTADLTEKIPKLVLSCGGNSMLNNGNFPETLSQWQNEVLDKAKTLEETEKEVEEIELRQHQFLYAAAGLTRLFQSICNMSKVCDFYEMSLEFFTELVEKLFRKKFPPKSQSFSSEDLESSLSSESSRKDVIKKMLEYLEEDLVLELFKFSARSMLKHHLYQFSLMLCIKTILDECDQPEQRKQLKGEISILSLSAAQYSSSEEEPERAESNFIGQHNWLSKRQVETLDQLEKLKGFHGLRVSILSAETSMWKNWIMLSSQPVENNLPGEWDSKLTAFQKLVLVSILRPDWVKSQIQELAKEVLGEEYSNFLVSALLIDVKVIYNDSVTHTGTPFHSSTISTTPIVFLTNDVCEAGGRPDPKPGVQSLANSLNPPQKLYSLSVSKMNTHLARQLIEEGSNRGFWVYLDNCHLCGDWLWTLEEMLRQNTTACHKNFKLWMCTKITAKAFPSYIIRNSIKMAVEMPSTIKLGMERLESKITDASSVQHYLAHDGDIFSSEKFKHLLCALCYLHCQLQGQAKFQKFGTFPEAYPTFQDIDFEISFSILKTFVQKYCGDDVDSQILSQQFPWWALKYMLELQYMNHFSNETPQQLIREKLQKIFNADSILSQEDSFIITKEKCEFYDQETFGTFLNLPSNLNLLMNKIETKMILSETFIIQLFQQVLV